MDVSRQLSQRMFPRSARILLAIGSLLTGITLLAQDERPAAVKNPVAPPPTGYLVQVPLPITGNADRAVTTQIRRLIKARKGKESSTVIVLQFGRSLDEDGTGSEFGRSYDLAKFLTSEEVGGVRTVAYIPANLTGHALLPVMACSEIVMQSKGELGKAGSQGEKTDDVVRGAYQQIAARRQTLPAAVALGIVDPSLEVLRANVKDGTRWILAPDLPAVEAEPGFVGYDTIKKRGDSGNFTAEELRTKFAFVSRLVEDNGELADALQLAKLSDDPAIADGWRPVRIDVNGQINSRTTSRIMRGLSDRLAQGKESGEPVNFIFVHIDSAGGSAVDSMALANFLRELDSSRVRVVGYIAGEARADAAIVALACHELVAQSEAALGGPGAIVLEGDRANDAVLRVKQLAKDRNRHWSLWGAMLNRKLVVSEYTRQGTGQTAFFCDEELKSQRDPAEWEKGESVTDGKNLFTTTGEKAQGYGLVDHVVADLKEFRNFYGLDTELEPVHQNWAHALVENMRSNWLAPWMLVFMGSFALMAELSSPGIGVPGFIALMCFLLFFWLKVLDGTASGLEILLFVAGIGCLLIEIFVLPGFGIFGLGGGAMVVASVVLASQTFVLPRNEYQLEQLPASLFTVVAAGGGVLAAIFVMRQFAHRTPGLSHVILAPPSNEELAEVDRRESLAHFTHLLGKRGTTVTQLTPGGRARFGDDLVDVITSGELISRGSNIVVVGVQGNVVLVEAIEERA